MSKASELEELKIYKVLLKHLTWNDTAGAKKAAKVLTNLGYTKSPFDVEGLKAWLVELQKLNKWEGENKPPDIFQLILDKIAELETNPQQKEGR